MTPGFELTAPAERDLEDIFFEVKDRHGRLVAERVYSNLLRTLDLLASMPEMGRHRPDLWPPPYRFWPTGPADDGGITRLGHDLLRADDGAYLPTAVDHHAHQIDAVAPTGDDPHRRRNDLGGQEHERCEAPQHRAEARVEKQRETKPIGTGPISPRATAQDCDDSGEACEGDGDLGQCRQHVLRVYLATLERLTPR